VSTCEVRRGRQAFWLTVAALAWSAVLIGAAFLFPAYGSSSSAAQASGSQTLVQVNGLGVLIPVGVPLVVSAMVWAALHHKCARGGRVGDYIARTCVGLLGCFCLLAILSIGIYVAPVAVLLACAVSLTPPGSRVS
jgi:hypothetical protein